MGRKKASSANVQRLSKDKIHANSWNSSQIDVLRQEEIITSQGSSNVDLALIGDRSGSQDVHKGSRKRHKKNNNSTKAICFVYAIEAAPKKEERGVCFEGIKLDLKLREDYHGEFELLSETLKEFFGSRGSLKLGMGKESGYTERFLLSNSYKCGGEEGEEASRFLLAHAFFEEDFTAHIWYLIEKMYVDVYATKVLREDSDGMSIEVMLHLRPEVLEGEDVFSDEAFSTMNKLALGIKPLMEFRWAHLKLISIARNLEAKDKDEVNIEELYRAIRPDNTTLPDFSSPLELLPTLRPYQKRAVLWMLGREKGTGKRRKQLSFIPKEDGNRDDEEKNLHPMWTQLYDEGGRPFLYNPYSGRLTRKHFCYPEDDEVKGGILADEMGLGKTVETLACIFSHRAPEAFSKELIPSPSDPKAKLVNSKGTLIVSPTAISRQWKDEIRKHIDSRSLTVKIYEGITVEGPISPELLASYDIVITTYQALRNDIYFCDLKTNKRNLRFHKKYKPSASPLPLIHWWRICLDEAQMVESKTANCAKMALKLSCTNRWCVTGTPIERGLDDIFGLLLFLGPRPLCYSQLWEVVIKRPVCCGSRLAKDTLYSFLDGLLWRTVKDDVSHELYIPEQNDYLQQLDFLPVEAHFYRKQHEQCSEAAMVVLNRLWRQLRGKEDSILSYDSAKKLIRPLLKLRQACCHPQIGKGGQLSLHHKGAITMVELLDELISNSKLECEEEQRVVVAALNGLAGLSFIENDLQSAADLYRNALALVASNEQHFRVDPLQKLHTCFNLNQCLKLASESDPPISLPKTLRDDGLEKEVEDIKHKYVRKFQEPCENAFKTFHDITKEAEVLLNEDPELQTWWYDVLKAIENTHSGVELVEAVRTDLIESFSSSSNAALASLANSFNDISGLYFILSKELPSIMKGRGSLLLKLSKLSSSPAKGDVYVSGNCRFCRPGKTGPKCVYCEADAIFKAYEKLLFCSIKTATNKTVKGEAEEFEEGEEFKEDEDLLVEEEKYLDPAERRKHKKSETTWADSEIERILRSITNFVRHKTNIKWPKSAELGKQHIKVFSHLKKEFKAARSAWVSLTYLVSALDELEMSLMRMRLQLPDEEVDEYNKLFVIPKIQIEDQRLKLSSDKLVALGTLERSKGQLLYLKNLKENTETNSGHNKELCPICHDELGTQWAVFPCGHCVCTECVVALIEHRKSDRFRCPNCRENVGIHSFSYVNTRPNYCTENEGGASSSVKVVGSYGTKIENIIHKLLYIKEQSPGAKSIVFSQWTDVLELLSVGLTKNYLSHVRPKSRKDFFSSIEKFKQSVDILLLPIESGSNGLNLIEATHVFLVEPSLNPGVELQAVNRVHRIGQTKPTFVHRFIIRNTVEKNVFRLSHKKVLDSHDNDEHTTPALASSVRKPSSRGRSNNLSLRDFLSLFGGLTDNSEIITVDETEQSDSKAGEFPPFESEMFWNAMVEYNGRLMSRHVVLNHLNILRAHERARTQEDDSPDIEKKVDLFGKVVHIQSARKLFACHTLEDDNPAVSSFVKKLKERIEGL
eukprot:Nk52_evm23s967 gene=Nk52_evmTU23s967